MSYDSDVVAATSGLGGEVDWDKIIKLCDRIRESFGASAMGSALSAVMRRIKHNDSMIQIQALTLLEACVSNCGKDFLLELNKSGFHSQVKELLSSRSLDQRSIQRLKTLLVTWFEDYKTDSLMSVFVHFVDQLIKDGTIIVQSGSQSLAPPSSTTSSSNQEDSDLQKAIKLSLQEANSHTVYPSLSPQPQKKQSTGKKVRALYDFQAAEDNELSFKAGEIITVTDDSDDKWWRGETQISKGLFPVNFVSTDLNASPEPVVKTKTSSSSVGQSTNVKNVQVNEAQVDLLLEMLKTADITSTDTEENRTLKHLEEECKVMQTMVDKNISQYQTQMDEMAEVSQKLQESFTLYRKMLQDGPRLSEKSSTIIKPPPEEPPSYNQSNNSYFAPPPPPEGTFHTSYTQPMVYVHPYAPPTQGFPQQPHLVIPRYSPQQTYSTLAPQDTSSGYTSGQFYQPPTDPVWGQTTLSTSPGTHQPLTLPQHQPLF